jgi:hypothetical protein
MLLKLVILSLLLSCSTSVGAQYWGYVSWENFQVVLSDTADSKVSLIREYKGKKKKPSKLKHFENGKIKLINERNKYNPKDIHFYYTGNRLDSIIAEGYKLKITRKVILTYFRKDSIQYQSLYVKADSAHRIYNRLYVLNDNGKCETEYFLANRTDSVYAKLNFEYDDKNRIITAINGWKDTTQTYRYEGDLLVEEWMLTYGPKRHIGRTKTFTYYPNGKVKTEIWRYPDFGFDRFHTYAPNKHLVEHIFIPVEGGIGGDKKKASYYETHYQDGRIIKETKGKRNKVLNWYEYELITH